MTQRVTKQFQLLICVSLLLLSTFSFAVEKQLPFDVKVLEQKAVPLMGITSVDDLDVEFEEPNAHAGGGMEMQRFFSTTIINKLSNCRNEIDGVFTQWTAQHGLVPSQRLQTSDTLVLRIMDKGQRGLFEAGYVFNQRPSYVRASLDYYELNGNKISPETSGEMLTSYHLSKLWTDLSEALKCD